VCAQGELISFWLYKEHNNLRNWKNIFTLHIPPWAPHTYNFVVLTSSTQKGKILSVVVQTTRPQLIWPPQCSKISSLEVFLEVRKGVVVWRGQIRWVGRVFQNLKVKIRQILLRNVLLVRSSIVLKKQDSFRNLPRGLEISCCVCLSISAT
jgi:hypothetical protein